jgi:hypothetical protein
MPQENEGVETAMSSRSAATKNCAQRKQFTTAAPLHRLHAMRNVSSHTIKQHVVTGQQATS